MALGLCFAPLACGLAPIVGQGNYAEAMRSEHISHSTAGNQSQAYRDKNAKILLVEHVVGLAQHYYGALLVSEGCVLLDGGVLPVLLLWYVLLSCPLTASLTAAERD